jgi:hypothetical protein
LTKGYYVYNLTVKGGANTQIQNWKAAARFRWIQIALFIILAAWLATVNPQEISRSILVFPVFGAMGYAIDWLGMAKLKLWEYPRQPFKKSSYYALVVTGWAILSIAINQFWNWCWTSIAYSPSVDFTNRVLIFTVVYAVFVGLCEIPNFKTKTWTYNAPWWLILIGWIPLIGLIRLVYLYAPA